VIRRRFKIGPDDFDDCIRMTQSDALPMILLALGSNVGDRQAALFDARAGIEAAGVRVLQASSVHETRALVPEGAPADWARAYLNQVLRAQTTLAPHELLQAVKRIEMTLGRRPAERWAPRVIDIDILDYDGLCMADEQLELPHAQMHLRSFVMAPLCEIAPDWMHPRLRRTAADILQELVP
jgi:2-amino-4-hydroxy-6-hydroxymethyldihydropteridine diphosphokinase